MRTLYAWRVSVPYLFHEEEKIVVAPSIEAVLLWLTDHMKAMEKPFCRIDSVVNLGEVIMQCQDDVPRGAP